MSADHVSLDGRAPALARMVHYRSHGTPLRADGSQEFPPACRAAVVTEVEAGDGQPVSLCVLNPTGFFFNRHIHRDPELGGGTWHWYEECSG